MSRRALIRVRFAPYIGRVLDHLPAFLRFGWVAETGTIPPEPIYSQPRQVKDEAQQSC
jgi:hypothetical protein